MANGHGGRGFLVMVFSGFAIFACSSGGEHGSGSGNTGGNSGGNAGGSSGALMVGTGNSPGTGASSGSGGATAGGVLAGVNGQRPGATSTVTPVVPSDACAGTVYEGEAIPLDMIVMMDRSISMGDSRPEYLLTSGGTKWDAVRTGFQTFVNLPQAAGLGMGIDFFGQSNNTCDPQTYATPDVGIARLPGVGAAIMMAYNNWQPGSGTPMGPALEGALIYAKQYKQQHLGDAVIVVLATDGVPNGCGASPMPSDVLRMGVDGIAQIAATYVNGNPSIPTYVLGIQGMEVPIADFDYTVNTIATAGKGQAIIVQANSDLATTFADALDRIRGNAAPPCSFSIPLPPPGAMLDLNLVNVALEPVGSAPEGVLNVPDANSCQYGGWYYNPPSAPVSIELCPNTCQVVSGQTGAGFKVFFGCSTVTQIQ